jgi:hydroxysqualene synthase
LINFWQDLSIDLPRRRIYIPAADAARFGLDVDRLQAGDDSDASRELIRSLVAWARQTMLVGAPLVHSVPGRMGWELRFVVQGGLRVLDKIEASGCRALSQRPTIGPADLPLMTWRALLMKHASPLVMGHPADERVQ